MAEGSGWRTTALVLGGFAAGTVGLSAPLLFGLGMAVGVVCGVKFGASARASVEVIKPRRRAQ